MKRSHYERRNGFSVSFLKHIPILERTFLILESCFLCLSPLILSFPARKTMVTLTTIWSLAKPLYGYDKPRRVSVQVYRTLRFIRFCDSNGTFPWILRSFFEKSFTEVESCFPRNKSIYNMELNMACRTYARRTTRRSEIDGAISSQCSVKFQKQRDENIARVHYVVMLPRVQPPWYSLSTRLLSAHIFLYASAIL
jgi:hypothetical protein